VNLKFSANEPVYFPIRALDFDPEEQIIWTGDDVGYMARWDVKPLLYKLRETEKRHLANIEKQKCSTAQSQSQTQAKATKSAATFITGTSEGEKEQDNL
jgi:hypothetical protein